MTTYSYNRSLFGSRDVHIGQLYEEIENSSVHPTKYLNRVFNNEAEDKIEVTFEQPLDDTEMRVMDETMDLHDGATEDALSRGSTWIASDVKSTGSNGGSAEAKRWTVRTLNTLAGSASDACTLAADEITLKRGEYKLEATVPAYSVQSHVARIYSVTKERVVATGSAAHRFDSDKDKGYSASQTYATVAAVVEVDGAQESFVIEHYCSNAHKSSGLGRANGIKDTPEVYTTVEIQQIS